MSSRYRQHRALGTFPLLKAMQHHQSWGWPATLHAPVSKTNGIEAIHRRVGYHTGASASWPCRRLCGLGKHERTTDGNLDACTNGRVRQYPNVIPLQTAMAGQMPSTMAPMATAMLMLNGGLTTLTACCLCSCPLVVSTFLWILRSFGLHKCRLHGRFVK